MITLDLLLCVGYMVQVVFVVVSEFLLIFTPGKNNFAAGFAETVLRWGKLNAKGWKDSPLYVPKRWFTFYYVTGVFMTSSLLYLVAFNQPLLRSTLAFLDTFTRYFGVRIPVGSPAATGSVSEYQCYNFANAEVVTLVLALLVLQTSRRLYECLAVSVFSNQRFLILTYFVGHYHYIACPLILVLQSSVVCEEQQIQVDFRQISLGVAEIIACCVFAFAWFEQHRILRIFARLRASKDKNTHYIPTGSYWFELVACPHYTVEILLYWATYAILGWHHLGWLTVVLFVMSNQFSTALATNAWYRQKFEDYPKSRKAIIPWIL